MTSSARSYALVTLGYWCFTLTDGALRMLVLLHFHALGFSPLSLATLFLLYEVFGVITNLVGGWIGSRFGLKLTLLTGLALQVISLVMLAQLQLSWATGTQVLFVFLAQGLSGIAKDFTKVSAKSAIRILLPTREQDESTNRLFRWVALLTGSKNTLKGVGFFLGSWLLAWHGFRWSLYGMAIGVGVSFLLISLLLDSGLGKAPFKSSLRSILSKSRKVNWLSLGRFFLFGARDIWFSVALPVYLYDVLDYSFVAVGTYLALWVMGYGVVQAASPRFARRHDAKALAVWGLVLALVPVAIASSLPLSTELVLLVGLGLFGLVFAINSAIHSKLILELASEGTVAMDVGFYYMANAGGRLLGTVLSGAIYQAFGFRACLAVSAGMLVAAALASFVLSRTASGAHSSTAM